VPLIFAAVVLGFAAVLSFRIPQVGPRGTLQGPPPDDETELAVRGNPN